MKVAVAGAVTVWLCGWVAIDGGVLEGEGEGPGAGEGEGAGAEAIELELPPQPVSAEKVMSVEKTQSTGMNRWIRLRSERTFIPCLSGAKGVYSECRFFDV